MSDPAARAPTLRAALAKLFDALEDPALSDKATPLGTVTAREGFDPSTGEDFVEVTLLPAPAPPEQCPVCKRPRDVSPVCQCRCVHCHGNHPSDYCYDI